MRGAKFIFPITDGTVKLSGGDQDLRTFTLILDSPDRGEEQYHLQGESDGSSSIPLRDSSWYDGEARNDFWSISGDSIYRHHVEPRVKLYVLREESFLIPLKYVDVTRKYPYILRCDVVEKYWRLLECWWRSWIVRYVDWFHKIHCIEWKKHWMDIHAPGGDWRGNKRPQDPTEMWKHMSDASWRKDRETEARQCQKFAWFFLHWSCRWGIQAFYVECSCRLQRFPYTETCCAVGEHKTKYACIVEADETLRIRMEGSQSKNHEDRIAGKGMNPLTHHNLGANLFLCLKQWKYQMQKRQWIKNVRNLKRFLRGTWQKSETNQRWSMKQGRKTEKFILPHWWTHVIWKMLNWMQNTKNTKVELYSEVRL